MSFFCLLWVPFFYLLRRTFVGNSSSGGVWALLLGSLTAIIQFFLGDIGSPGGFGYSRWFFGFINIVSLPVLLPLIIYTFLCIFRGFSGDIDFTNFVLLWLIPVGALRALSWSSQNAPLLLVMVPLLWTALAVGIPFFIRLMMENFRWYTASLSILCILILPSLASTAYWAFFSQHTFIGFLLLLAANIPFGLSLAFDVLRS